MNALKTILHEILGLFVDDGTLTMATLLWLAVVWFLLRPLHLPVAASILLFLGLAAILVESVTRFARKSSR
jgi:hypothetical protein